MNKYWILFLRYALGVLFIYASLDKILHPLEFARAVENYRLLPPVLVNLMGVVLPWIEVICGLALISGVCSDGAVLIISFLLVIFIVAMGQATFRGIDIGCGCFKVTDEGTKVGWERIGEDLLMLLAALNIIFYRFKYRFSETAFDKVK